jgi:hypothetical protein
VATVRPPRWYAGMCEPAVAYVILAKRFLNEATECLTSITKSTTIFLYRYRDRDTTAPAEMIRISELFDDQVERRIDSYSPVRRQ